MIERLESIKTLLAGQIFVGSSEGETVLIPREGLLFSAEFQRDGSDLVLINEMQPSVRITGYFNHAEAPPITDPSGGELSGRVVELLAGPIAPGQYAQLPNLAGAAGADIIGQVENLTGTASVRRTDGTEEEMTASTKVFANDVVSTGVDGQLSITFADGTIFTMAANSRMVLDDLIYDPNATDNSATFDLVEGSFVFIAGAVAKTGGMTVNTPAATMGIRGTTVHVDIQTVNGVTTVEVSLNRDPDGELGSFTLTRLDGTVIDTLDTTETKWVVSPIEGETREVFRTVEDLASDQVLITRAAASFGSAIERVNNGGNYVEGADGRIEDGRRGDLGSGIGTDFASNGFIDGPDARPRGGAGELFTQTGGREPGAGPLSGDDRSGPRAQGPQQDERGPGTTPEGDGQTASSSGFVGFDLPDLGLTVNEDGQTTVFGFNLTNPSGGLLTTTITAGSTVTLVPGSGVTILVGDGVDDEMLVIRGTAEQINAALDGLTYKPSANADDEGSLTFSVTDGVTTVTAQTSVTIIPAQDPPEANDDALTRSEDSNLVVGNVLANDTDPDTTPVPDVLSVQSAEAIIYSYPQALTLGVPTILGDGGRFVLFADGTYSFDPLGNYSDLGVGDTRVEEITVTVVDSTGNTDTSVLRITITGTDSAPEISSGLRGATEDQTLNFDLTDFALDPEGGALTFTAALFNGEAVTIDADTTLSTGEVIRVNADGTGSIVFTGENEGLRGGEILDRPLEFTAQDGAGNASTGSVTLRASGVNDAPSLSPISVPLVEGGSIVQMAGGLTITDPDSDVGDRSFIILTLPTNGTVTFQGVPVTIGQSITQAQMSATGFRYTHDGSETTSDSFDFAVDDGDGGSTVATSSYTITPANDAPVIAVDDSDGAYSEGDAPQGAFKVTSLTDADDTNIESARVSISNNFEAGDTLSFADTRDIVSSYDATSGVLTITGTASLADYEAALRSVQFSNTTNDDVTANFRTFSVSVNDGDVDSMVASAFQQVLAV
ncbi:MAG: Ig-like domain-containing protein, partial [Pseudomonadota bacterium]